jgi:hypothetical protein
MVGETGQVRLQPRFELCGLLRRQHNFSLRTSLVPSIDHVIPPSINLRVWAVSRSERLCDTAGSAIISGSSDRSGSYGPGPAATPHPLHGCRKPSPAIAETGVLDMCRMSRM